MKKYLTTLALVVMIVPQVALASWWNPFSWSAFHSTNAQSQSSETIVVDNPGNNLATTSSSTVVGNEESVKSSSVWWNPFSWGMSKKGSNVVTHAESNVIDIATTTFNELTKDSLIFCNGSKYKKCSEGQTFICPTNGDDAFCEKNKSDEVKIPKTKDSSVLQPVTKTITPAKTPIVSNNEVQPARDYSGIVGAYRDMIVSVDTLNRYIDDTVSSVNTRENMLTQLINTPLVSSADNVEQILKDFSVGLTRLQSGEKNLLEAQKGVLVAYKKLLTDSRANIQNKIIDYQTKIISESVVENDVLGIKNSNEALNTIKVKIEETVNKFLENSREYNGLYESGLNNVSTYIGRQIDSTKYTPQVANIQPIQMPKITNCNIEHYGSNSMVQCLSF